MKEMIEEGEVCLQVLRVMLPEYPYYRVSLRVYYFGAVADMILNLDESVEIVGNGFEGLKITYRAASPKIVSFDIFYQGFCTARFLKPDEITDVDVRGIHPLAMENHR